MHTHTHTYTHTHTHIYIYIYIYEPAGVCGARIGDCAKAAIEDDLGGDSPYIEPPLVLLVLMRSVSMRPVWPLYVCMYVCLYVCMC